MKYPILYLSIFCTILLCCSCQSKPNVEGNWTGSPIKLNMSGNTSSSALISLSFTNDNDDQNAGDVTLTALINIDDPDPSVGKVISDYDVNVAATARISGKWHYEKGDDSDIVIALDHNTLAIDIDKQGIKFLQKKQLTDETFNDENMVNLIETFKAYIKNAITDKFNEYQKIEDISISNDVMSCEVADHKLSLKKNKTE